MEEEIYAVSIRLQRNNFQEFYSLPVRIQFIVLSSFSLQDYISFIYYLVFFYVVFSFGAVVFHLKREDNIGFLLSNSHSLSTAVVFSPWKLTAFRGISVSAVNFQDGEKRVHT